MAVVGSTVAKVAVVVVIDDHWYFHGYGVRPIYMDRDVLLNSDGVGPVDGHLHGVRYGLLNSNWDLFVNRVWFWVRYFHGYGVGLLNMDWVRPVDWDMYGYGYWFFDSNRVRDRLVNGVRCGHMYWVRPVDGNFDRVTDVLDYRVRLGNGYLNFDWVWHVFLHGVRLRHGHLDGVWDVFLDGVGLGYENLNGVRPVDGDVHWIGDLFLDWVWGRYMDGDFDVLLHVNGHVFDDLVGLGYRDLYWVRYVSIYGVRDGSVDGYRVRDAFD